MLVENNNRTSQTNLRRDSLGAVTEFTVKDKREDSPIKE